MEEGIRMDIVIGIRIRIGGWGWEHPLAPERTSTENNFLWSLLIPANLSDDLRHPQRAIVVPCWSLSCSGSQGHWARTVSSWGPSQGSFIPWDQMSVLPWPHAKLGSWDPREILILFHTRQSRAWRNAP